EEPELLGLAARPLDRVALLGLHHERELLEVAQRIDAQDRAARALVDAVRVLVAAAQVALDRALRDLGARALLLGERAHRDVAVGALAGAVLAPDAVVVDVDVTVGEALDRAGRAADHALRVAAVPAARRQHDVLVAALVDLRAAPEDRAAAVEARVRVA